MNMPPPGLAVSTQFCRVHDYLGSELANVITSPAALAATRLKLVEQIAPMSKYVGVIRVGDADGVLFDLLLDTTDSDNHHRAFAHVLYLPLFVPFLQALQTKMGVDLGPAIVVPSLPTVAAGLPTAPNVP